MKNLSEKFSLNCANQLLLLVPELCAARFIKMQVTVQDRDAAMRSLRNCIQLQPNTLDNSYWKFVFDFHHKKDEKNLLGEIH